MCFDGLGAIWDADLPLDQFDPAAPVHPGAVVVRAASHLSERAVLRTVNSGTVYVDGFRFGWGDEATFDMTNGDLIEYLPGPGWKGAMPAAFYSTVAALTLAWRGLLPYHASAIEVAGRAILIAGDSGAGKSTLTAAMLRHGANLTAVEPPRPGEPILLCRGRTTLRLHRDTAASLPALDRRAVPDDDRGKWLVRPVARTRCRRLPLSGVLLLGRVDGAIETRQAIGLLSRHLFRPRWLQALPGQAERLRMVMAVAGSVPCMRVDAGKGFHCDPDALDRARRAVDTMIAAPPVAMRHG